jgi:hypothetical protein
MYGEAAGKKRVHRSADAGEILEELKTSGSVDVCLTHRDPWMNAVVSARIKRT